MEVFAILDLKTILLQLIRVKPSRELFLFSRIWVWVLETPRVGQQAMRELKLVNIALFYMHWKIKQKLLPLT
jgi:hypothetical protein